MFIVGSLAIAYLGAAAYLDRVGHREPPHSRYDAIVVLGCRVRPDGTASLTLARRARHGARLYTQGLAPRLVLTGGVGDHPPSEAQAAAVIAMQAGVPESAIVLEDASTSTDENAREAAARIDANRVLVVSDAYHTYRATRVFRRYFEHVDAVGSSGTRSVRVRGALREVSAVAAYALLGRM